MYGLGEVRIIGGLIGSHGVVADMEVVDGVMEALDIGMVVEEGDLILPQHLHLQLLLLLQHLHLQLLLLLQHLHPPHPHLQLQALKTLYLKHSRRMNQVIIIIIGLIIIIALYYSNQQKREERKPNKSVKKQCIFVQLKLFSKCYFSNRKKQTTTIAD
jgi:hypothetical protein